jgi:hypothetical protein
MNSGKEEKVMDATMTKTSVYSEKLGKNMDISVMMGNAYGVNFSYPESMNDRQEWSNGYWNRSSGGGDYWNRSW